MLDSYQIITITHRNANAENIGRLMVAHDNLIEDIKLQFEWDELLYLPTCNRVLFLFYSSSPCSQQTIFHLISLIRPDLSIPEINAVVEAAHLYRGVEAINHFLQVAASVDSLVPGEREIVHQLRKAYEHCRTLGHTGDHIRLLMRHATETAKLIFTQTDIGEKPLSVVAIAFDALRKAFPDPKATIALVGAGETNALFGKFLTKYQYKKCTVYNRTYSKALTLAGAIGGTAQPLESLFSLQPNHQIIIICTGASKPLLDAAFLAKAEKNNSLPQLIIDLSLPANTAPEVSRYPSVNYIGLDKIKEITAIHLNHRQVARNEALGLIDVAVKQYRQRWHERQVEKTMQGIPDAIREVKEKALSVVFAQQLSQLDPQTRALVGDMLDYMERKCVAVPMKAVKEITLQAKKKQVVAY